MSIKSVQLLISAVLCLLPFQNSNAQDNKTLLIMDQSIKTLSGMPYPTGYEFREVGTVSGGGPVMINVSGYNPAMSAGANIGMNVGAGLIASAIVDAAIHAEHNKKIASLREPVNMLHLKKLALDIISNKVKGGEQGQILNYFVPGASDTIIKKIQKIEKNTRFGNVYVVQKMQTPVIALSYDNYQLMIVAEVQKHSATAYDSKQISSHKFAYVALAPSGEDSSKPLDYWQSNEFSNFLTETKNGFNRIIDFVASDADISNAKGVEKQITLLNIDGMIYELPGKLYKIAENHAYVIDDNGLIRIAHGKTISEYIPEAASQ